MTMRWLLRSISRSAVRPPRLGPGVKRLSTVASSLHDIGRVSVPVGSSGSVNIDLHNLAKVPSSEPLLVYLPPFITEELGGLTRLPEFCEGRATAVINYRCMEDSDEDESVHSDDSDREGIFLRRFHPGWPAPLHDTLVAYTWIVNNLAPPDDQRRDIYVYGSYLGASLATSLALTETYPRKPMAIRGCVAHNGIYDWTMFFPEHPINWTHQLQPRDVLEESLTLPGGFYFQELKRMARILFKTPADLFDPFASPCLFFCTPELTIPSSFVGLDSLDKVYSPELSEESTDKLVKKHLRQHQLRFPPHFSPLQIPDMLLLHDTPPSLRRPSQKGRRQKYGYGNDFQAQAEALASLMRSSIVSSEYWARGSLFDDPGSLDNEANEWVQVYNVGADGESSDGENITVEWLEGQISSRR
ncbi:hypothetical protein F4861DRAFT_41325 [Xylaria intraflava]|nr:hypothetical protein F4861DRAFT_41325 [Xylaria intraflava]